MRVARVINALFIKYTQDLQFGIREEDYYPFLMFLLSFKEISESEWNIALFLTLSK